MLEARDQGMYALVTARSNCRDRLLAAYSAVDKHLKKCNVPALFTVRPSTPNTTIITELWSIISLRIPPNDPVEGGRNDRYDVEEVLELHAFPTEYSRVCLRNIKAGR